MFENTESTSLTKHSNGESSQALLNDLLKSPYEQLLETLKRAETRDSEATATPSVILVNHIRMPGQVGPVGPVGKIEDLKL